MLPGPAKGDPHEGHHFHFVKVVGPEMVSPVPPVPRRDIKSGNASRFLLNSPAVGRRGSGPDRLKKRSGFFRAKKHNSGPYSAPELLPFPHCIRSALVLQYRGEADRMGPGLSGTRRNTGLSGD